MTIESNSQEFADSKEDNSPPTDRTFSPPPIVGRAQIDLQTIEDIAKFIRTAENPLSKIQSEILSEGTRKDQRTLLTVAFLLLFISLGSLEISDAGLETPGGIKLSVDAAENVKRLGFLICLFFEVTYSIRSFVDWTSYRIRRTLADTELRIIEKEVEGRVRDFYSTKDGMVYKVLRSWARLEGEPPPDQTEELEKKTDHDRKTYALIEKRAWIQKHAGFVRIGGFLRVGLEVLFPIGFGAYALFVTYESTCWLRFCH